MTEIQMPLQCPCNETRTKSVAVSFCRSGLHQKQLLGTLHTANCTLPSQSLQNSTFASSIELAMKKVNTRACQNKSISDYVAILVFFGRFLKNWTHLVKIEAPILYETDLRYHTTKKFQNIDMIGVTFVFLTPY